MANKKLGLVLSGGGAKGAYQAGILKYMAEIHMQPAMVSGTSIGALNAAVISAQKDICKASITINHIWEELGKASPIKVNKGALFISSVAIILSFSNTLSRTVIGGLFDKVLDKLGVAEDQPLMNILDKHAPIKSLQEGLPLYVALYESDGSSVDIVKYISSQLINTSTKNSEFMHIQSLDQAIMHEVIMASAALPYLFKAKEIEGKMYRDGGIGGANKEQGNTPAQPLVSAGCTHLIVSLLNDGSTFDRHDPIYKDVAIIEVRPKKFLSNFILDMFAFSPEKINIWQSQGYDDAKRCIGNSVQALDLLNQHEQSKAMVHKVLGKLDNDGFSIGD